MLIWNRLKAHAASQGEKLAIVCGDTRLSYAQFAAKAEALAHSWLQQGLQPGDRVALHWRNGIELATCYYACFAAGLVAVPVNNRLTPEEIAYVLDHSGARAYLAQPELRVETSIPLQFDLSAEGGASGAGRDLAAANPDDPALLLYTSGTTARPKGVIHTQRTLAGNALYMDAWGVTPEDHTLLFTSMAHASGAIMLLISSLWLGATVTIVPVFDAATVLDTWARSGATFYMGLPTLIRALVAEQRARPRSIASGRLAIGGGDTVPVALQEEYTALFGHPLVEGFGMTEGLPMLANHPKANRPGSMGRPLGDVEIRVVDGEMWVRGGGISIGYWRDAPFEDWLKTGDLVEVDADGFVWFRGRKKEIIVRGGSNISPQEVEETLYRHPAVAEAGVIGDPTRECRCTGAIIQRYLGKLSGPLLDRIDLHIEVPAVPYQELRGKDGGVSSAAMRERVCAARDLQQGRGYYNAHIPAGELRKLCELDAAGERTLEMAVRRMGLSARAHDRILKVARTIADLDHAAGVSAKHLAEAVQYRSLDRNYWQ